MGTSIAVVLGIEMNKPKSKVPRSSGTLAPGSYTVQADGVDRTTDIALLNTAVEVGH